MGSITEENLVHQLSSMASYIRIALALSLALAAASGEELRSRIGLMALYDFNESQGTDIKDVAGVGAPLDLEIEKITQVTRQKGALKVTARATIKSKKPAARFQAAVKRTGELTLETWVEPANLKQSGPARIVTLSKDGSNRNLTLGQEGNQFSVRMRTKKTSANGIPSVDSDKGTVKTALTHVVYTRDRSGRTHLYLNGEKVEEKTIDGSTSNWARDYHLGLANEMSNDRPWLGTFHLVALYSRDLLPHEVRNHFQLGPDAETAPAPELVKVDPNEQLFDEAIAPIFAKHCLECHDAATNKGKLDLSSKVAATKGGSEGTAIEAGHADQSLLWDVVQADEMPHDREPLSPTEKALLKEWIDGGAKWASPTIDPLAHKRDRRATENWVRRLTLSEYIDTVRSSVGVDIRKEATELLPKDLRADGFNNTAYNLGVDFKHIESYAELASIIVSRMDMKAFAKRFNRRIQFTDKAMATLLQRMGTWLLRGPLEDHEIIAYRGISTTVASGGGSYEEAAAYIVEAMLQSPRFIYQVENQRGDGQVWPVSEYELASRLSYMLWGSSPDKTLMDGAEKGRLYDRVEVEKEVDRMLDDPRTITRSLEFASQWLNLGRLQNLRPNADKFPSWDPALAEDMKAETLAFFKEVVWENGRPLGDLLNAPYTFTTPRLAKHYNLAVTIDNTPNSLQRVNLEKDKARGGLLTHGSILTIGGDEASTVTRGLLVLHDLLRSGVNDPPPGVDTTPVPSEPGRTQRSIAEERIQSKSCGGCHQKFEPLAFGMSKFDGLGTFLEKDHFGNALQDDGEILFPGDSKAIPFRSSAELMDLLAKSSLVQENLTWKVTQFALGRPLVGSDTPHIKKIHAQAQKEGGTYKAILKAIALSDYIQSTRTEALNEP
ncbi:DUF1592 domain-containing protein [bacterium]|jgi:hypothetical protein|nr:DUF1592 domain-containing protein [bacterium]